MKVPIEWLKELVKIKASPEKLAELLTMSGLETVVEPGNILEIDVLPNRSDCWCIRGIAREVAALKADCRLQTTDRRPKIKERKDSSIKVKVEVHDPKLCPRYMARVISNVKVAESPEWIKERLEKAGIRSINNVVDVTNYLLLELGQPMHAFDASLINEQTIIVRRAKQGEKISTLDGKEHALDGDMLLIADPAKPIAVAGVMGGGNTEVNPRTRTVILESAFFNPVSIHKTSKFLKLRSESSIRFEHGVDWDVVEEALERGAKMIADLGKGFVLSGKVDKKAKEVKPKVVTIRPERVNRMLGTEISKVEMLGILKRLGFGVKGNKVAIPLYRAADIYREIDLIEEIARIYGFGKIDASMPSTAFPDKGVDEGDNFRQQVREIMVGAGFNEAQCYSMVGPADFVKAGLSADKALKVANPLNIEEGYMRTMLLPGLLNVVVHNLNRQVENIFVFEIGKIFIPSGEKLPQEKWVLSAAAVGSPFRSALDKGAAEYSYVKGVLENIFQSLGLPDQKFIESRDPFLQPGRGSDIQGLGLAGELHPEIRKRYGIEGTVGFFEIDLDALFKLAKTERRYKPLPKFPSVSRDISLFVPKGVENQMIIAMIKKSGGELVSDAYLFDKYKESLAYRVVYRNPERTLTDVEVNAMQEQITTALESKLNVRVRR